MWKETITYTDFFGEQRTEDFRFHLSQAECAERQMKYAGGGYAEFLRKIIDAKIGFLEKFYSTSCIFVNIHKVTH